MELPNEIYVAVDNIDQLWTRNRLLDTDVRYVREGLGNVAEGDAVAIVMRSLPQVWDDEARQAIDSFVNSYTSVDENGDQYMTVEDFKEYLADLFRRQ